MRIMNGAEVGVPVAYFKILAPHSIHGVEKQHETPQPEYMTGRAPCHKGVLGSGDMAPLIL
jgi:hypothetical protein